MNVRDKLSVLTLGAEVSAYAVNIYCSLRKVVREDNMSTALFVL